MFTFDVPPTIWLVTEDGIELASSLTSTRATSINGRLNITSGATPGNTCELESRRHPRYQPDRGLKWAASIGFKGANLDGILKAGMFVDAENGVYFKTKGDGLLYACVLKNSIETHEEVITFPFDIDITLGNIYDIQMQWRGVGSIYFYIGNPSTGRLVLVHTIEFLNTLDETLSFDNPALSANYYAENTTQEVSLWGGCVDISTEGGGVEKAQYGAHTSTKTVSSGAGIVALKSPTLISARRNTRDIVLARITIASDKKVTIKVYQTRDSTAIVGGAFATFLSGSYIEANTTMTSVDIAKMNEFSSFKIAAGSFVERENPNPEIIDFYLVHGDYLVLVADTAATAEIDATIEWGEEI